MDDEIEEEFEDGDDDDEVEVDVIAPEDDILEADPEEIDDPIEPVVPARRAGTSDDDESEEEDDEDPDDVEEDLDTILKDRIASGDDLEDEDEDEVPDPRDPDTADGVTAKRAGEFTCHGCFMIVHPRQFGRKGRLACPVGDEDCPSVAVVAKQLG